MGQQLSLLGSFPPEASRLKDPKVTSDYISSHSSSSNRPRSLLPFEALLHKSRGAVPHLPLQLQIIPLSSLTPVLQSLASFHFLRYVGPFFIARLLHLLFLLPAVLFPQFSHNSYLCPLGLKSSSPSPRALPWTVTSNSSSPSHLCSFSS